jgi:tellurite resistance protein
MKDTAIAHGAALNALDRVTVLIAANVFVITATNKLISQKLSTTRQMMKKKQDMKYSESITLNINVDH